MMGQDKLSEIYNRAEWLAEEYGLSVSQLVLVLASESQARLRRSHFDVVED